MLAAILVISVCFSGCGSSGNSGSSGASSDSSASSADESLQTDGSSGSSDGDAQENGAKGTNAYKSLGKAGVPPEIGGLEYESEKKMERAEKFSVFYYKGEYSLIDIHDHQRFLLAPEGADAPDAEVGLSDLEIPDGITVLQMPVDRIYLAATATMAMFTSMGALDHIRMSSIKEEDWSFDEPRKAMAEGDIVYAGKYSSPDYETMIDQECDLAIESTMIDHTPEVQEMIEDIDIPVLVDRSSYESDPMGRAEWIKLYGVITGHEKEADAFFTSQMDSLSELENVEDTGKTVAFFYLTADGKVVARSSDDYVPKMIEMAGGKYIFSDLTSGNDNAAVDMSVETFYETAKDADIIIYNSSIDGSVKTLADLAGKDPIMTELKAVQEGSCWITGSSMYQRTDIVADMIRDFHNVINGGDPSELKYIEKLQ